MNEKANSALKAIIDRAEKTFRDAEAKFEKEGDALQRSSQSILQSTAAITADLQGKHEAHRLCRELYNSHEATVLLLDEQCRAYLGQQIDGALVVRIAELIEEINGESRNIGLNSYVSINGEEAGIYEMISYEPGVAAVAAEQFWDAQVELLPDREEAYCRYNLYLEKQQEIKDKAARKEAEKQQSILAMRKSVSDGHRAEIAAAASVRQKKAEILLQAQQYHDALFQLLSQQLADRELEVVAQCAALDTEQQRLRQSRSSLGLFDRAGRDAVSAQIAQLQSMKEQLKSPHAAQQYAKRLQKTVEAEAERYRAELLQYTEKRFPYFAARKAYVQAKAADGVYEKTDDYRAHLTAMRVLLENGPLTPEEMQPLDPRFAAFNRKQMYEMMRSAQQERETGNFSFKVIGDAAAGEDPPCIIRYTYEGRSLEYPEASGVDIPIDYEDENCAAVCPPVPDAAAFFQNL